MVQAYPHRSDELAAYLSDIVDMATDYGGTMFYQYHKQFSARAAALLLNHSVKVDWSIKDNDLYCKVFAGRRANSCDLCSSIAHSTEFCPLNLHQPKNQFLKRPITERSRSMTTTAYQSKRVKYDLMPSGQEICNNFNTKGCSRGSNCLYAHACMLCKSEMHSRAECNQAQGNRIPGANANYKADTFVQPKANSTAKAQRGNKQ